MGDFHTLVIASGCNCINPIFDRCDGKHECEGGSNLYSWGFNIYGQCNGMPSQ